MNVSKLPALQKFLSTTLFDQDQDADLATTKSHTESLNENDRIKLQSEMRSFMEQAEIPLDEIGSESNRWFGTQEEAKDWLQSLFSIIEASGGGNDSVEVVDSNGTRLEEGDSVTVIKDLKVKGGSSDLKRGTLVKKIHLTSDPGLIECKVDGTVLVLKTEFLKKS
jgi:protein PhnA